MTFERNDGIRISDINRIESSFAPDTETAFCPKAVLRKSICTSEPFLVILCDTLFLWSKLVFLTFESAATYRFLYMKVASFSPKNAIEVKPPFQFF